MECKSLASIQTFVTHVHIYCRFRWVNCQLGYLRRCLPGRIRRALHELPETLNETYERALKDIDKANWEVAHRLLQFVTVASRPLRVEELGQFLGFDFAAGLIPKFHGTWLLEDPVYTAFHSAEFAGDCRPQWFAGDSVFAFFCQGILDIRSPCRIK